jgi:NodT family efflux transporter outer membrane factor (OMF) lipoprotein
MDHGPGGCGLTTRIEEVHEVHSHGNRGYVIASRPRATAWAVLPLGVALMLAGCAVGPKYVRPVTPLNESWSPTGAPGVSTQASPDSSWWKEFQDPALDRLVDLAYQQNLSLQLAGLRIAEARAQLSIAVGNKYPQVQVVTGSATAVGLTDRMADNLGVDRDFWDFQVGFDAVWEVDFWGKLKQNERAQAASYFAKVADRDHAIVSLTAEVARTYAVIRTFEVLIEQARANATVQEEGLRMAESRFRNGVTSELDVTQATVLLETTRGSIPKLEMGLQQSQNALSTLLGRPTGSLPELALGTKGIPTAPAEAAVSVPADLLRRRPDVRSAEYSAMAQCARIGIAKADLYPSFALFGSIGTQGLSGAASQTGATFSKIFETGSFFYSFGPRLLWNLLDYGRTKNKVRTEDARFQQTLVGYHDTVLKAAQEVEDGLAGYVKSRETVVFAERAVEGAKRSVEIALVQYREGAVDYQRVLDAQRSLLDVENDLARTQSSIATSWIALYKALGGGWEIRQGLPAISDSTRVEMEQRTNWGNKLTTMPAAERSDSPPPTP